MNVDQAIRTRRSVRGFLPTEVPEEILHEIFALGQAAPSGCNAQPWAPHVVSGAALEALREELVATARKGVAYDSDLPPERKFDGVYRRRQVDAAVQLYGALGIGRSEVAARNEAFFANLAFFGAPHAVFIFLPKPFDIWEAIDAGIYAQTLILAMTARGIASCAQGALGLYPSIVRRHLGVGNEQRLLFGISFGYEDPSAKANATRVGRAPVQDAVRFHR